MGKGKGQVFKRTPIVFCVLLEAGAKLLKREHFDVLYPEQQQIFVNIQYATWTALMRTTFLSEILILGWWKLDKFGSYLSGVYSFLLNSIVPQIMECRARPIRMAVQSAIYRHNFWMPKY